MDNLLVYTYKIIGEDCKKYNGLIARYNNSKDLFICTKDNEKRLISDKQTFKELTQKVLDGKIAVFPIWEKQETENRKHRRAHKIWLFCYSLEVQGL